MRQLSLEIYKCDELFSPDKQEWLYTLLATHIRYHAFFANYLGQEHAAVAQFSSACFRVGLSTETVKEWGATIDNDVKKRNEENLAFVEGVPQNAGKEIALLKGQVSELKTVVKKQTEMLERLVALVTPASGVPAAAQSPALLPRMCDHTTNACV